MSDGFPCGLKDYEQTCLKVLDVLISYDSFDSVSVLSLYTPVASARTMMAALMLDNTYGRC
ncbi:hypothetical protein QTP88_017725 [Uroleucon formosanum]